MKWTLTSYSAKGPILMNNQLLCHGVEAVDLLLLHNHLDKKVLQKILRRGAVTSGDVVHQLLHVIGLLLQEIFLPGL